MNSDHVGTFVLVYTAMVCFLSLAAGLLTRAKGSWLRVLTTGLALTAAVVAVSLAAPGQNGVVGTARHLAELDPGHLVAACAALSAGLLTALAIHGHSTTRWRQLVGQGAHLGVTLAFAVFLLKHVLGLLVALSGQRGNGSAELPFSKFRVDEIARLELAPTALAVGPDDRLYACGYAGVALQSGGVVRLDSDSQSGGFRETLVARDLSRPHGLAFYGQDLFVSRSGQFSRAVNGKLIPEDTGTVTRLRDLDGDGIFDHYTDVISGLPGAQPPDTLHQNNGIAIDSKGTIYVAVGNPSDHLPVLHRFAGSVIRSKVDGSDLTVFARGFRNPYGITIGPDDQVFCTDNDGNTYKNGDTVSHVVEGRHYGFPFTSLDKKDLTVSGLTPPIAVSMTALSGMTYVPTGGLPAGYDECLYIAANGTSYVNRIRLRKQDGGYSGTLEPFLPIPGLVVSVTYSPHEKVLYACSFDQRKVYRIAPQ
jgi:glucose/arabinose dehydrogenase